MTYPDQDELKNFAREPRIFPTVADMERVVQDDMTIVYTDTLSQPDSPAYPGIPRVRFIFTPAYIDAEVKNGEYERVTDEYSHETVWDKALDTEVSEDYIVATAHIVRNGHMAQFEAYWLLDRIEFDSPAINRE